MMIVEGEEEDLRDFTTIYKNDYLGKKAKRLTECRPLHEYPPPLNILNGPYKQYLNTRQESQSLPENERSEDPVDCLNRLHNEFPHLKNVLPQTVPNENVIEYDKQNSRKTVYQLDYSKELDEHFQTQLDHLVRDVALPENWFIPETVQKCAYRNPWLIAPKNLIKPPNTVKPCNHLDPNPKERKILRVTTGNSEYFDRIGVTGQKIIFQNISEIKEHKLQKPLKSPEISDSQCSLIMKQNLTLPSKVF